MGSATQGGFWCRVMKWTDAGGSASVARRTLPPSGWFRASPCCSPAQRVVPHSFT